MKNLAGVQDADKSILEELYLAGIKAVKTETSKSEVPFSYVGKVGNWTFKILWYYWSASVEDRADGVLLEDAMELNNRKHPTDETTTLGKTIRAGGHGGGISPDDYVGEPIYNSELSAECKALGIETQTQKSMGFGDDETEYPKLNRGEMAKLCNEGKIKAKRYVDAYHIDDQIGLNEFAKFIKSKSN